MFWCVPTSTNGVGVDVMHYFINGWRVYGFISETEGDHFIYMLVFRQDNIIRAGIYDCTQEVH